MAEEQKVPETWEDFQQARRDAFQKGAAWLYRSEFYTTGSESSEARRRYPIRRRVPREVRFFWHFEPATVVNDLDPKVKLPSGVTHLTATDLDALRDLLARPYDEVED